VKRNPSLLLMPLSFGAILGGLVTLIGTPPNVIVATYRGEALGEPFGMFAFTPVGGTVMLAGLAFVALLGWRLVPERSAGQDAVEAFELEEYLVEARVPGTDAEAHGMRLRDLQDAAERHDALIAGVIRNEERIPLSRRTFELQTRDVILIEADPQALDALMDDLDLKPVGDRSRGKARSRFLESAEAGLAEAVVEPRGQAEGSTPADLHLHRRFGVVLLGVSRQGRAQRGRMRDLRLKAGDVLLLHGETERLGEAVAELDLLPLRERGYSYGRRGGAPWLLGIFALAIGAASLGLVTVPVALGAAVALIVGLGMMPLGEVYKSVDWPVIVLLASLIPLGGALESTGATALVVDGVERVAAGLPAFAVLALLIVVTMSLSDVLNNAATAVVMAPLALELAERLSMSPDAFLMSVAVGASCAFLTPIGHQNNALIFGPGGYRFSDYWRMGLPLELLIVAVATPMIMLVWPP
jgi:di/tricarboxylate transporter